MNKNLKSSGVEKVGIKVVGPAGWESDNVGGQCSVKTPVTALNKIAQILRAQI